MFFLFWIVAELLFGEGVKVFGGAAGSGCDLMAESRPVIENLGGSGEFVLDMSEQNDEKLNEIKKKLGEYENAGK